MAATSRMHQANEYRQTMFFPSANTTFANRLKASTAVGGGSVLLAAGDVELVGALAFGGGPLWTAITGGGAACSAACADGDCTNEVNVVYRSVEDGVTQYVGITNNFLRRSMEHSGRFNIQRIPGLGKLSRFDARAVEQVLIEKYQLQKNGGILLNRINSIAKTNPIYDEAIKRGTEILNQIGFIP
jgi:hypothetical protein